MTDFDKVPCPSYQARRCTNTKLVVFDRVLMKGKSLQTEHPLEFPHRLTCQAYDRQTQKVAAIFFN